jgi:hypothetical protein
MMATMNKAIIPLRATVVGLTGKQATALLQEVGSHFDLRILTPERALRFRGNDSDIVITTRFIGHKHERHLRRVSDCRVIVLHSGGAQAVVNTLRALSITLPKAA